MSLIIKEHSYKPFNGFISSQLVLEITNGTLIIANTFRRVVHDDLPAYAFPPELIKIEQNTTTFNNDYMRDHLCNLPVVNLKNEIVYLDPKYWKDIDFKDLEREKHPDEQIIDLYVNIHNDTQNNMYITTDNAKIYLDGTLTDLYKHYTEKPLLIQLKPNMTFKCHMKSALCVGEKNNIWASGIVFYEELENKKILLTIESFGQMGEYELLIKSCDYLNYKLTEFYNYIKKEIGKNNIPDQKILILEIDDEDHTFGMILNDYLQNHPNIIFSGVAKPDNLIRFIKITIECDNKFKNPTEPVLETIKTIIDIFNDIKNQINNLKKNNINNNKKK